MKTTDGHTHISLVNGKNKSRSAKIRADNFTNYIREDDIEAIIGIYSEKKNLDNFVNDLVHDGSGNSKH